MKSFLICPVRGVPAETHAAVVTQLESEGFVVHWPPRDTDQNDPTGLRICRDNAKAIAAADVIHVVWDGQSQGCLFDLGVAFALSKRICPITLPAASEGKSFQNMIMAWQREP
jgi:nucleoside 2-deoxyribosyltransferase